MNWLLILLLTIVGAAMALLSVFGIVRSGFELVVWTLLAIVSAYLIAKKGGRVPLLEGITLGAITGIVHSVIQSAMFSTYLLNNPESLGSFQDLRMNIPPQYIVLLAGPVIGLIYGGVIGIIAMSLRKVIDTNE